MMDASDIRRRFEVLKSQRKVVEEQWQAIEKFVAP